MSNDDELLGLFQGAIDCQQGKTDNDILSELEEHSERYGEKDFIASGGMKNIYRHVSMATIPKDSLDPVKESFLREARITAKLQHPNIIPVHDMGLIDGQPFFTMKLLVGETLESVIENLTLGDKAYIKRFPLSMRVSIFQRVCEAVSYAHSKGIIHLDLKPANIHISDFNEVTLCDWGIAKIVDEVSEDHQLVRYSLDQFDLNNMTIDGFIKGTPGFMAPEQAGGKGQKDFRTDIYALGALLYNLLTLEKIITATDLDEYVKKTVEGDIRKPSELNAKVPISLEAISMKALSCKVEDRYQKIQELSKDLLNYINGFATLAEDAGFITQLKLLFKRNKTIITLLSVFCLTLLMMISFFFMRLSEKETQTRKAYTKLQEEKEARQRLAESSVKMHLKEIEKAYKSMDLDRALIHLKTISLLQPKYQLPKELHSKLMIGKGDFSSLAKILGENTYTANTLEHVFHHLKENNDEHLYRFAQKNIHRYLCKTDKQKENYLAVLLKLDNPKIKKLFISFKDLELKLSGTQGLRDLKAINVFPIQKLDVSHCDFFDLNEVKHEHLTHLNCAYSSLLRLPHWRDVKLKKLDIRFCPIFVLTPLQNFTIERLELVGVLGLIDAIRDYENIKSITLAERYKKYHLRGDPRVKHQKISEKDLPRLVKNFFFTEVDKTKDRLLSSDEFPYDLELFNSWDKDKDKKLNFNEYLPEAYLNQNWKKIYTFMQTVQKKRLGPRGHRQPRRIQQQEQKTSENEMEDFFF